MKLLRAGLAGIGLLVSIVTLSLCHGSDPTDTAAPARPTRWHVLASWKGNGTKRTEPFSIRSTQWRVAWNTRMTGVGNFIAVVQRPGSDFPLATAANVTASGADTSYVYVTGEVVLDIISANASWEVTVEVPD